MKYVPIVGVAALALIVAIIAYRYFTSQRGGFGGFRDWVKNPDYQRAAEDYFAAREALTVPDDISDDEIRRMVERLFVQRDDDFNFERLKLVGAKAVPFLIRALDDPRTATAHFGDGDHVADAKSPFERICSLLDPLGPAEAARPLAKYVDHKDNHFRNYAAMTLGGIGSPECIPPMLKALDDEDDNVRSYAMIGIRDGIEAGRCRREFLDAMFPALAKLLNRDDSSVSGEAPALLLNIDAARAIEVMLSPEYFTVENGEVHYILRALNRMGHKVPHEILLTFLANVKPLAEKYPHEYTYAEALKAYAHNPDAATEQTLAAEINSPIEEVREAAAQSLAVLSGVTNAQDVVFQAAKHRGFDGMSSPQKHYYAVFVYNAEVNNGGHSQYFFNSSGDRWKWALEGLRAMGAAERAAILQEAIAAFGANGPPEEHSARRRQLAKFSRQNDAILDKLDERYYNTKENIEVLLAKYALANRDHFISSEPSPQQ